MEYYEARDMPFETDDLPTSAQLQVAALAGLHPGIRSDRGRSLIRAANRAIPDF